MLGFSGPSSKWERGHRASGPGFCPVTSQKGKQTQEDSESPGPPINGAALGHQSALLSEPHSTWGWPMNAGPVALGSFPGFAQELVCDLRNFCVMSRESHGLSQPVFPFGTRVLRTQVLCVPRSQPRAGSGTQQALTFCSGSKDQGNTHPHSCPSLCLRASLLFPGESKGATAWPRREATPGSSSPA